VGDRASVGEEVSELGDLAGLPQTGTEAGEFAGANRLPKTLPQFPGLVGDFSRLAFKEGGGEDGVDGRDGGEAEWQLREFLGGKGTHGINFGKGIVDIVTRVV